MPRVTLTFDIPPHTAPEDMDEISEALAALHELYVWHPERFALAEGVIQALFVMEKLPHGIDA